MACCFEVSEVQYCINREIQTAQLFLICCETEVESNDKQEFDLGTFLGWGRRKTENAQRKLVK